MRILILTPWPLCARGGTQTLVTGLAEALRVDSGLDVVIVTGDMPEKIEEDTVSPGEIRRPLVSRPWPAWLPPPRHLVGGVFFSDLEKIITETAPDAILYTPHNSPCAHQAARAARERSLPFLFWPLIHLDQPRHTNRAARKLYRSASVVLASSEVERLWLLERARVASERILKLGGGWWKGASPSSPIAERGPVPLRTPLRLLSVGEFAPHKRFEDQIGAVEVLRSVFHLEAHLTIAGTVRERAVFDHLQTLIRRRKMEDWVSLRANCSSAEIANLYRSAHFFLFTSASESIGLSLADAIGFGTFPVIYPHPVYREIVESSGFGMIAHRPSPRALARATYVAWKNGGLSSAEKRRRFLSERSWTSLAALLARRLAEGFA